ncbi:MAG: aldehyde ferredoxin oxidoreductase C-terminal domain-containing protein, partial [Dehalococcoidales bacterium]|nr:aldehyde ferredoxin oxidoreductase C-terminal domain-containing protein [Dehalococcoidales bacterium]
LRYLYDLLPPGYAATDPETPMIFMTSPLTGLPLPGATNITLATKNFDTGFTVARSHTHGKFGILTKAAGYDGFIITGKSDKPVYLWVHDGRAELRDAGALWGKLDSHDTEDAIKKELGNSKISVAAIGPTGENLCAGGMICNDRNHSFSHCGVGSTMGAKNLKAIAVFGEQVIPVADPEKLAVMNREWLNHIKMPSHYGYTWMRGQRSKKGEYRGFLKNLGFVGQNFRVNQLTEFGLGWSQQKFTAKPCPRCPVGCCYDLEVTTGPHQGYVATVSGGGEALEGAGAILGITEPGAIFYLTDLYDRLGIEGSIAGCTLAMAIEAYEKGLITRKDTDGLELRWGDEKIAEALLKKMVYREGFGNTLARGIKEAAEAIGGSAPDFAVHVKGTGMSLHDWRAAWGMLFGQIVGSGAGWPAPGADCFNKEPDAGYPEFTPRYDYRSKPTEARRMGIQKFFNDCAGFCMFITWGCEDVLQLTADTLAAATGQSYSREELLEIGERVMQLERAFNVRHGLKPEDDWTVPERLIEAPADGPAKGISIKPYLKGMVKEYHKLMGWDEKTGKPWRSTLERVGLDDVAKDLWE